MKKLLGLTLGFIMMSSAITVQAVEPILPDNTPQQAAETQTEGRKHFSEKDKARFEERMQEQKAEFAERLKLTEEQQKKADAIHQNSREKMKLIMEEMKSLRQKADAVRDESRKEFESLLNDEQKNILKEMNKERMERRKDRKDSHEKFARRHHRPDRGIHSFFADKK